MTTKRCGNCSKFSTLMFAGAIIAALYSTLAGANCDGTMGPSNNNNSTDDDKPIIMPPDDAEFECDGAGNSAEIEAWLADVTSTEGCGEVTLSHDYEGDPAVCEAVTVTWTATDECSESGTASSTFTIVDGVAPEVTVPDDISVTCGDAGTADAFEAWFNSAAATDNCGDPVLTSVRSAAAGDCTATITWTATDSCGNAVSDSATYTTDGDTTAPEMTIDGDPEVTIECGSAWVDPGVIASDDCDALITPDISGEVDASTPGEYELTYSIVDACGNEGPTFVRTVTVVDTTPPVVELKETIELWPPNHRLETLTLADLLTVTDSCEGELDPNVFGTILELYSDEPDDSNGDGNTTGDIAIDDEHTFTVRVERQGGSNGRVYGVRFEITDSEGNTVEETAFVHVPHDQSGSTAVDDGAASGQSITP